MKSFLTILMNFNTIVFGNWELMVVQLTLPITIKCSNFNVGTYYFGKFQKVNKVALDKCDYRIFTIRYYFCRIVF